MRKIGILTFHNCDNYGAVLQVYALQQVIKSMGYEPEIINYSRDNLKDVLKMFSVKISSVLRGKPDRQLYSLKEFLDMVFKGEGNTKELREPFAEFRKKYLLCSEPVNKKTIKKIQDRYDRIIVGSDQVWNCGRVNIEPTYMLDFVTDNQKKCSYAASFGISEIPEKYLEIYQELLSQFSHISVREKAGKRLVKELTGKDTEVVLDPTLLLRKEKWQQIARKEDEGEYILVYQLGNASNLLNIARKLSKRTGLPIKVVKKMEGMGDDVIGCNGLSPVDWVSAFLNARYILTSSFHGVAFSINFNKEFWAVKAEDRIREAMQSRIVNVLELTGLESRYIAGFDEISTEEKIAYDEVNERLDRLGEISLNYLKEIL